MLSTFVSHKLFVADSVYVGYRFLNSINTFPASSLRLTLLFDTFYLAGAGFLQESLEAGKLVREEHIFNAGQAYGLVRYSMYWHAVDYNFSLLPGFSNISYWSVRKYVKLFPVKPCIVTSIRAKSLFFKTVYHYYKVYLVVGT